MTIKQIKIQALKLMFVGYAESISEETWDELVYNENYSGYISDMDGAIQRAFGTIEAKDVLAPQAAELDVLTERNGRLVFDTEELDDYDAAERVTFETPYEYDDDVEFDIKNGEIYLPRRCEIRYTYSDGGAHEPSGVKGVYTLYYKRALPRIFDDDTDIREFGVSNKIAELIPYYIKGDLYRDDEPSEAAEARNWFEAGMEQISRRAQNRQTRVRSVYSIEDI